MLQKQIKNDLNGLDRIIFLQSQNYLPFVALMRDTTLILSDSGGIQEEATALKKPLLLLRDTTERPKSLSEGVVTIVGCNPEVICDAVKASLQSNQDLSKTSCPFGNGNASKHIINVLKENKTA